MENKINEVIGQIETFIKTGNTFKAYNNAKTSLETYPNNKRLMQLYALSLARLGATEKARTFLEELRDKAPDKCDCETIGVLGRVYKDILKKSGNKDYAVFSKDTYLKGFKCINDYYLGINAATMSFIIGEKEKADEIAKRVIEIINSEPKQGFWEFAALGEAYLILNDMDNANLYYKKAFDISEDNYGNINSAFQQLNFIAKYREVPAKLLKIFKPKTIIVFSGHMIDNPNRENERFPDYIAEDIKKEIIHTLDKLDAGVGYCSAACGSDILFIEAMLERGAEVNVFLPFCKKDFFKNSVSYAGEKWEQRFNKAIKNMKLKYITDEGYYGDDDLYSVLNNILMGMSIIRSNLVLSEPVLVAVLEKRKEGPPKQGGTEDLLYKWPYKENIKIIETSVVLSEYKNKHKNYINKSEKSSIKQKEFSIIKPPEGVLRSVNCILFADVTGFTRYHEDVNPDFMYKFVSAVSRQVETLENKPDVFNSWGNAIYAIFKKTKDIIEFALLLREIITTTDWELYDFNGKLSIRIALHIGPCFISLDPFTKAPNSYGTHINRTACLEAITIPGCIYATEQFTAQMATETGNLYQYEYVGNQDLSEEYGGYGIYNVSRRDDFSFLISDYKREQKVKFSEKVKQYKEQTVSEKSEKNEIFSNQTDNYLPQNMFSQLKSDENEQKTEETDSFAWLILYMTEKNYKKGDVLFNKGDRADKIYYLDKGILKLKELGIIVKEKELIGETGIFSPLHTRTATVICDSDVTVHILSQDKMIDLLYKKPSLLFDLIKLSIKRFSSNLTSSIEEREKIKSELKVAKAIQTSMLPTIFPDKSEFDIFAMMEPAKEVGGDFYDFFFINEDKFCFIIGDVSGKGIPAALFMVISKALLKMASINDIPPHEVLSLVNEMLYPDNDECMFVTVFYVILNIKTGELQYANAGHNPPLVSAGGKNFKFLDIKKSFVIGAMPNIEFATETMKLNKGDIIYLYTDGVNEAMNEDSKQYSNERLNNTLSKFKDNNVNEIVQKVREDIFDFVEDSLQSDDMTMLALKYNG